MTLGQKLRAYRKSRHWTLPEAAKRFGEDRHWLNRRELGKTDCTAQDLAAFMRIYRLTNDQLADLVEAAA
jgi:transcriptional regulator with XRE-family HTH domain